MDVIGKLIRLLQDDYKLSAEMRSGKPILYIDPKKIDQWKLDIDTKNGNFDRTAKQMAEQIDSQYPDASKNFSQEELVQLVKESLVKGPFAWKFYHDGVTNGTICLINEPQKDAISVDQIYNKFGISRTFNPSHLRPLVGGNGEWAQFVGEHEGEHCNQDPIYSEDPKADVKTLNNEALSDRAALETIRKEGKHEMVAQIIAIRALAAADGDSEHATSIFLSDPKFTGVTREHLNAAKRFKDEMCMGVAANLGISFEDAKLLRTTDPQAFSRATEDALKKAQIPALYNMTDDEMKATVAKELGLSPDELSKVEIYKVSETYQKLKAQGALQNQREPNPHINKYINSYIEATRVLFVDDTTPPSVAKVEIEAGPKIQPEEEALLISEATAQASDLMDRMVKKALGINDEVLENFLKKDQSKYYEVVAQELAKGNIPTQTERDLGEEEVAGLLAQKLRVPIEKLGEQPAFLTHLAKIELAKENALWVKKDNPYLAKTLQDIIQDFHEKNIEPISPKSPPKLEEIKPESKISPSNLSDPEKYRYPFMTQKDDGGGKLQVDLHSGNCGHMRIGAMTVSEYFATKADPILASQPPVIALQGTEIRDPSLTTKDAQNSAIYLINSSMR